MNNRRAGHTGIRASPSVLRTTNEDDYHRNGAGLTLSRKAKKSLMEWEPVSERILTARFQSKFQKVKYNAMLQQTLHTPVRSQGGLP